MSLNVPRPPADCCVVDKKKHRRTAIMSSKKHPEDWGRAERDVRAVSDKIAKGMLGVECLPLKLRYSIKSMTGRLGITEPVAAANVRMCVSTFSGRADTLMANGCCLGGRTTSHTLVVGPTGSNKSGMIAMLSKAIPKVQDCLSQLWECYEYKWDLEKKERSIQLVPGTPSLSEDERRALLGPDGNMCCVVWNSTIPSISSAATVEAFCQALVERPNALLFFDEAEAILPEVCAPSSAGKTGPGWRQVMCIVAGAPDTLVRETITRGVAVATDISARVLMCGHAEDIVHVYKQDKDQINYQGRQRLYHLRPAFQKMKELTGPYGAKSKDPMPPILLCAALMHCVNWSGRVGLEAVEAMDLGDEVSDKEEKARLKKMAFVKEQASWEKMLGETQKFIRPSRFTSADVESADDFANKWFDQMVSGEEALHNVRDEVLSKHYVKRKNQMRGEMACDCTLEVCAEVLSSETVSALKLVDIGGGRKEWVMQKSADVDLAALILKELRGRQSRRFSGNAASSDKCYPQFPGQPSGAHEDLEAHLGPNYAQAAGYDCKTCLVMKDGDAAVVASERVFEVSLEAMERAAAVEEMMFTGKIACVLACLGQEERRTVMAVASAQPACSPLVAKVSTYLSDDASSTATGGRAGLATAGPAQVERSLGAKFQAVDDTEAYLRKTLNAMILASGSRLAVTKFFETGPGKKVKKLKVKDQVVTHQDCHFVTIHHGSFALCDATNMLLPALLEASGLGWCATWKKLDGSSAKSNNQGLRYIYCFSKCMYSGLTDPAAKLKFEGNLKNLTSVKQLKDYAAFIDRPGKTHPSITWCPDAFKVTGEPQLCQRGCCNPHLKDSAFKIRLDGLCAVLQTLLFKKAEGGEESTKRKDRGDADVVDAPAPAPASTTHSWPFPDYGRSPDEMDKLQVEAALVKSHAMEVIYREGTFFKAGVDSTMEWKDYTDNDGRNLVLAIIEYQAAGGYLSDIRALVQVDQDPDRERAWDWFEKDFNAKLRPVALREAAVPSDTSDIDEEPTTPTGGTTTTRDGSPRPAAKSPRPRSPAAQAPAPAPAPAPAQSNVFDF